MLKVRGCQRPDGDIADLSAGPCERHGQSSGPRVARGLSGRKTLQRKINTLAAMADYSSFFINPASAAKGLWVALAIFGVLREPSPKYCWSV